MARVKSGVTTRRRHKKYIKLAKGFRGRAKNCFSIAVQKVEKGLQYAYRDRRARKRDFRKLWIIRLNAAVRNYEMTYSQFMHGLKLSNITINRKVLANIAINSPAEFEVIAQQARNALSA